jgi:hypothetical protein
MKQNIFVCGRYKNSTQQTLIRDVVPVLCPRISFRTVFPLFYCHTSFVMSRNLITTHICAVSQCLLCYAAENTVVISDYKLPILNLLKIKVL